MNLLLDRGAGRRNDELDALYAALGDCTDGGALMADSAMSGTITYTCERGRLLAGVLLASIRPAKIQKLEFTTQPTV